MEPKLIVENAYTQDNIRLAIGRYENPGKTPVILAHGLAQNHFSWDFPVPGHSFAQYLHKQGYDVWLPCFRGHGRGKVLSYTPHWEWNLDDLAIYDVPAIIKQVTERTGQIPLWIGHSMGGVLAYMYLQGVQYQKKEEKQKPAGDKILAHKRNAELLGLVTVAAPLYLQWSDLWGKLLASNTLRLVLQKLSKVPLASTSKYFDSLEEFPFFGKILQKATNWPIYKLASSAAFSLFWHPPNMNTHFIENILRYTLSDVNSKLLTQFMDWIVNKTFRSYPEELHSPYSENMSSLLTYPEAKYVPYIYGENMGSIEVPSLLIAGNMDKIADATVIFSKGFNKIGSSDKSYYCFDSYGHNDLCMGVPTPKTVFPFIRNWISDRFRLSPQKTYT